MTTNQNYYSHTLIVECMKLKLKMLKILAAIKKRLILIIILLRQNNMIIQTL